MAKKISAEAWQYIADRLRKRNTFTSASSINVELDLDEEGNGEITITPVLGHCNTLNCLEDVVDLTRAFDLSFYVGITSLPVVQPFVRIF